MMKQSSGRTDGGILPSSATSGAKYARPSVVSGGRKLSWCVGMKTLGVAASM